MVRRRRRRIWKIAGWILAGFIFLIILVTTVVFLGRDWIIRKFVEEVNQRQPGEIHMADIRLVPLMDFPDAVLHLKRVAYFENDTLANAASSAPIIALDEVYVSLDIVDLIHKNLEVSHLRLKDGFVNFEVYGDSVSNLERALGFRFGETESAENDTTGTSMGIDLEEIELDNIQARYRSRLSGDSVFIQINKVKSHFRYRDERIESSIKLNVDLNDIKYQDISIQNKDNINFNSEVLIEPDAYRIEIFPSKLDFAGLELETSGSYHFGEDPFINMEFKAVNSGLEVLNFLLLGILDLDEIRQIGSGSITLSGNVSGQVHGQLPVISLKGNVDRIGFRIKSIGRDVTGISFSLEASSGNAEDFSDAFVRIKGLKARSPEGNIRGDLSVRNLVRPQVAVNLDGDVNLEGVGRIIKSNAIKDLQGRVKIKADVAGILDRENEEFREDAGTVEAEVSDLGLVFGNDTLDQVTGSFFLDNHIMGSRDLGLTFNGNRANLDIELVNLVQYLMGYDRDVQASVALESELLRPARLLKDTALTSILGEELRGLEFKAEAKIKKKELDHFLKTDSIPKVDLRLENFRIELPYYHDISQVEASLTYGPDTISLHELKGTVGESKFHFSGQAANLSALGEKDTGAVISLDYHLDSDRMRAEDFFSYKDGFLLPETYRTEYLEDLHMAGSLHVPVNGLIHDSVDLDFGLELEDLAWKFRYYPLAFKDFNARIRKTGNELILDDLEGEVGESNLKLSALIGNYNDTVLENVYGYINLASDLLDFNELLNYELPDELKGNKEADTTETVEPPHLDQIDYPGIDFKVDIGELRFGKNKIFGMKGKVRSTPQKIFYLDSLVTSGESGGYIMVNGQFNVASPWFYNFSAKIKMEDVNVNDLDIPMQAGDSIYTLKENFTGSVTADGMAEVFLTPDLNLDIPTTTAMFNVEIRNGSLINFTPLKSVGKVLGSKNLDNVRFSTLRNRFTLIDSKVIIPRMVVESTIGQLLIEGEQGLDDTQLYLLRIPMWLVKDAIISKLIRIEEETDEEGIYKMRTGTFVLLTTWSNGEELKVKLGDKRDKYR